MATPPALPVLPRGSLPKYPHGGPRKRKKGPTSSTIADTTRHLKSVHAVASTSPFGCHATCWTCNSKQGNRRNYIVRCFSEQKQGVCVRETQDTFENTPTYRTTVTEGGERREKHTRRDRLRDGYREQQPRRCARSGQRERERRTHADDDIADKNKQSPVSRQPTYIYMPFPCSFSRPPTNLPRTCDP